LGRKFRKYFCFVNLKTASHVFYSSYYIIRTGFGDGLCVLHVREKPQTRKDPVGAEVSRKSESSAQHPGLTWRLTADLYHFLRRGRCPRFCFLVPELPSDPDDLE
jgi:hypothetical protein